MLFRPREEDCGRESFKAVAGLHSAYDNYAHIHKSLRKTALHRPSVWLAPRRRTCIDRFTGEKAVKLSKVFRFFAATPALYFLSIGSAIWWSLKLGQRPIFRLLPFSALSMVNLDLILR
jgi:hypothetical protein